MHRPQKGVRQARANEEAKAVRRCGHLRTAPRAPAHRRHVGLPRQEVGRDGGCCIRQSRRKPHTSMQTGSQRPESRPQAARTLEKKCVMPEWHVTASQAVKGRVHLQPPELLFLVCHAGNVVCLRPLQLAHGRGDIGSPPSSRTGQSAASG